MKVCPRCKFRNHESTPICLMCNSVIVHVRSKWFGGLTRSERERRRIHGRRYAATIFQSIFAGAIYAALITGSAYYWVELKHPIIWSRFLGSALLAFGAMRWNLVGQFTGPIFQGAMSLGLLMMYLDGSKTPPFTFHMLGIHIILAAFFWHWSEMIDSAHR